jgi:hypothetical protein
MGYIITAFMVLSLILVVWGVIDVWKQTKKY